MPRDKKSHTQVPPTVDLEMPLASVRGTVVARPRVHAVALPALLLRVPGLHRHRARHRPRVPSRTTHHHRSERAPDDGRPGGRRWRLHDGDVRTKLLPAPARAARVDLEVRTTPDRSLNQRAQRARFSNAGAVRLGLPDTCVVEWSRPARGLRAAGSYRDRGDLTTSAGEDEPIMFEHRAGCVAGPSPIARKETPAERLELTFVTQEEELRWSGGPGRS